MASKDYDAGKAFKRIEDELIRSMMRNLGRHLKEEEAEGFDWSQWQVEQLKYLEEYRRKNQDKYGPRFEEINGMIREAIWKSNDAGQKREELRILKKIAGNEELKRKYANRDASIEAQGDAFFRINDRKMEALVNATTNDMQRAERAVLRRTNDQYRKIIFDAQMYASSGAATPAKAVDMATKDFLSRGIDSIQYKNGSRHTISDYADMAVKTAERRAYLAGEGKKRQEWGEHLVIVNKRADDPCPHCMKWIGKILIDDVYSGGKPDGKHKLLSEAMEEGFLHPRCKDGFTTYFPGITSVPDPVTKEDVRKAERSEKAEAVRQRAERETEKYERLEEGSFDPENQRMYEARAEAWRRDYMDDVEVYGENPQTDIDYASADSFSGGNTEITNDLLSGDCQRVCEAVSFVLDGEEYGLPESGWSGVTKIGKLDSMPGILGRKEYTCEITIREDQKHNLKVFIHENLHARSISRFKKSAREQIYLANRRIEEGTVEYLAQEICKRSHISYVESYKTRVDALRDIKRIISPLSSDFDFAKELLEIPTDERYNYLKRKVEKYKASGQQIRKRVIERLDSDLSVLGEEGEKK